MEKVTCHPASTSSRQPVGNSNLSQKSSWFTNAHAHVPALLSLIFVMFSIEVTAQELPCATEDSPLLSTYEDFNTRDTLRPVMVWAVHWDSVNQVSNFQGESSEFWMHLGPEAPPWYHSFFDTTFNQSWINWVKTTSRGNMHVIADTSDVYVRNRTTRERFNYYSPAARGGCAYCMSIGYANQLYAEIDSMIDFSEYDADNDNIVDLLIVAMVYVTEGGQAHNLVDTWGSYTMDCTPNFGVGIQLV